MVKATKSDRYGKLQRLLKPERFLITALYGQGLKPGQCLYYFLMPDGVGVFIQARTFAEASKTRSQLIDSIHQTSDDMSKKYFGTMYKVNGRTFTTAWQVKEYLDQHDWIETDRETIELKNGRTVVLINVVSK